MSENLTARCIEKEITQSTYRAVAGVTECRFLSSQSVERIFSDREQVGAVSIAGQPVSNSSEDSCSLEELPYDRATAK